VSDMVLSERRSGIKMAIDIPFGEDVYHPILFLQIL
jgi:hypothetical protein